MSGSLPVIQDILTLQSLILIFSAFQICEMHIAGFNFSVLNNAFLVHKGYKVKNKFYSQKTSDHQENRQHYKNFIAELKSKYSDSTRKCEI